MYRHAEIEKVQSGKSTGKISLSSSCHDVEIVRKVNELDFTSRAIDGVRVI